MTTLVLEQEPEVVRVTVSAGEETSPGLLSAFLADGRVISAPLSWYPRLCQGTPEEWQNYELSGGGYGIHWPALDEDISIENLLEGRRSQESEQSFKRWLRLRQNQQKQEKRGAA